MKKLNVKHKLLALLLLVSALTVPFGVQAMLSANSNKVLNQFVGGYVNAAVMENGKAHENSDNNIQEYATLRTAKDSVSKVVTIKNLASEKNAVAMYTRVRLVPSIVGDGDNKGTILGGPIDLTYHFKKDTAWKVKDDTYYYTKSIDPNTESEVLLTNVTINQDIPEGYHLELKVIADSIVTRPVSIVEDTWNIKADFSDLNPLY